MKLLFISHEASRTGAPIALLQIIDCLKDHFEEFETDIFILKDGPLRTDFEKRGKVCMYKPTLFQRIKSKLFHCKISNNYWKSLPNKHYDLIYANTVCSLYAAKCIKEKTGSKVIAHIHESEYLVHKFGITRQHFSICDSVICVSELSKHNLVSNFGVDDRMIHIQHPFSSFALNLSCLIQSGKQPAETSPNEPFVVGLSGSGEWVKSFNILPLIIDRVHKEYPEIQVRYLLVGCQETDVQYRLLFDLRRMGLDNLLTITGSVADPISYYSIFDIFLMISREDSFPLVAAENALLGKPIIAFSGATGVSEWIDSSAGIQVPYMDIDALANVIRDLYYDRTLCHSMGQHAKELIMKDISKHSDLHIIKSQIESLCIHNVS